MAADRWRSTLVSAGSTLNRAEANTAAVSWLGWEGYPLYPRLDGGDVYGLQYGSALYQVNRVRSLAARAMDGALKILGLTAFALSQILSFVTLRRTGAGVAEALTMTGVQCVVLAGFTDQAYASGMRSDALLLLAAQTAVLVAPAAPTVVTAGVLGLLGGICVSLKIHGALFILPAFVYQLGQSPSERNGPAADGRGRVGACYRFGSPLLARATSRSSSTTIIFECSSSIRGSYGSLNRTLFSKRCAWRRSCCCLHYSPETFTRVQLVYSSAGSVHDNGNISCVDERSGATPSSSLSFRLSSGGHVGQVSTPPLDIDAPWKAEECDGRQWVLPAAAGNLGLAGTDTRHEPARPAGEVQYLGECLTNCRATALGPTVEKVGTERAFTLTFLVNAYARPS